VNTETPLPKTHFPTEEMTSERPRDPDNVRGRDTISIGKRSCGSLKTARDSFASGNEGKDQEAGGTESTQKDVLMKTPMQVLEPPHTPQSSTDLPLLQKSISQCAQKATESLQ
jgi:hypothetical protein